MMENGRKCTIEYIIGHTSTVTVSVSSELIFFVHGVPNNLNCLDQEDNILIFILNLKMNGPKDCYHFERLSYSVYFTLYIVITYFCLAL